MLQMLVRSQSSQLLMLEIQYDPVVIVEYHSSWKLLSFIFQTIYLFMPEFLAVAFLISNK